MNEQYIDLCKLIAKLHEQGVERSETITNIMKYAIFEDVAPVVHAHWVADDGELYCSNCKWTPEVLGGTTLSDLQLADVYHCPHCGAKMDGDS